MRAVGKGESNDNPEILDKGFRGTSDIPGLPSGGELGGENKNKQANKQIKQKQHTHSSDYGDRKKGKKKGEKTTSDYGERENKTKERLTMGRKKHNKTQPEPNPTMGRKHTHKKHM